jgi:hypothetical protein
MEELVEAATSENLTAEDWSLIIRITQQAEGYINTIYILGILKRQGKLLQR